MTARSTPAPGTRLPEAGQTRLGDAGSADTVAATNHNMAISASPPDLLCPRCGSLGPHQRGPGAGPHHARLTCACGMFVRWLSAHTPAEQAARREQARQATMAQRPPSVRQLSYLSALGYTGTVSSMASASITISALLQRRQEVEP